MSVLVSIVTLVGIIALVCVFWWAMIEAQTTVPGVNEPGHKKSDEKLELEFMEQVNNAKGEEVE